MRIRDQYNRVLELERKEKEEINLFNQEPITDQEKQELLLLQEKFKRNDLYLFFVDYYDLMNNILEMLETKGFNAKVVVDSERYWCATKENWFDGSMEKIYRTEYIVKLRLNDEIIPILTKDESINFHSRKKDPKKYNPVSILYQKTCINPRYTDYKISAQTADAISYIKDAVWNTIEQTYDARKNRDIEYTKQKIEEQKKTFLKQNKKLKDELKQIEDSIEF